MLKKIFLVIAIIFLLIFGWIAYMGHQGLSRFQSNTEATLQHSADLKKLQVELDKKAKEAADLQLANTKLKEELQLSNDALGNVLKTSQSSKLMEDQLKSLTESCEMKGKTKVVYQDRPVIIRQQRIIKKVEPVVEAKPQVLEHIYFKEAPVAQPVVKEVQKADPNTTIVINKIYVQDKNKGGPPQLIKETKKVHSGAYPNDLLK